MPSVSLAIPADQQRWPNSAACWSPRLARITARPPATAGSVTASSPAVGTTSGSSAAGTSKSASKSSSQASVAAPNSIVRAAIDGSVTCRAPPDRHQVSQQFTSPNRSRPASAAACAPGTWSSTQRSFGALNAASSGSPVRSRTSSSCPSARSRSHTAPARVSRQLTAGYTGSPEAASQTTNVSVCAASPIAATSGQPAPACSSASATAPVTLAVISCGSCSTQPLAGNCDRSGRPACASTRSCGSSTTHRLDELPWSIARRTVTAAAAPSDCAVRPGRRWP